MNASVLYSTRTVSELNVFVAVQRAALKCSACLCPSHCVLLLWRLIRLTDRVCVCVCVSVLSYHVWLA